MASQRGLTRLRKKLFDNKLESSYARQEAATHTLQVQRLSQAISSILSIDTEGLHLLGEKEGTRQALPELNTTFGDTFNLLELYLDIDGTNR